MGGNILTRADAYKKYAKLRDVRAMTDYRVAVEIGVVPSTFSNWKNGDYTPKTETLLKIAKLFNVSLEDLIYD